MRFLFVPRLNLFDSACVVAMTALVDQHTPWWWVGAIIPLVAVSVFFQNRAEAKDRTP